MAESRSNPSGAIWAWIALAFMAGILFGMSGLAVPFLGVGLSAFGIWIGVRIANRAEPSAKRLAIGVAAAMLIYVASFGPAC